MASPHNAANVNRRQKELSKLLADSDFDAVLLNAGSSQTYFSGLSFHLSERPYLVFFTESEAPVFLITEMEKGKIDSLEYDAQSFLYGEDPTTWPTVFADASAALGSISKVAVEFTQLRLLELRLLEQAMPGTSFEDGSELIAKMRQIKDNEEIAAMQKAAEIAEKALTQTWPMMKVGVSEKAIAAELTRQLLSLGSDPELPFHPIIASGPNAANPHASISDRKLQDGDLLIVDWGASVDGYFSDITRTFAVGQLDKQQQRIFSTVEMANKAARKMTAPGVACQEIDKAARDVIEEAGYGEYFIHRTGHGLGMESHEAPYIREGNAQILEEGMTFTIEPGIYLPGEGGVRIEDDVLVTSEGVLSFSQLPRSLKQIG